MKNSLKKTATKADVFFIGFIVMAMLTKSEFGFWYCMGFALFVAIFGGLFKK